MYVAMRAGRLVGELRDDKNRVVSGPEDGFDAFVDHLNGAVVAVERKFSAHYLITIFEMNARIRLPKVNIGQPNFKLVRSRVKHTPICKDDPNVICPLT